MKGLARASSAFLAVLSLCLVPATSDATVILNWTGTVPATSVDVSFQAALTISGNTLTIVLSNDSMGMGPASPTLNPADLLSSFYFDIADSLGNHPTLAYMGAAGNVYMGDQDAADLLMTAGANLMAVNPGDDTWQFQSGLALQAGTGVLSFGIGTTGNSSLNPNGFNGNIVGGFDYAIYAGDIGTRNLDGTPLVKQTATFTFTGVSGFLEADISREALFGLGTQPDSTGLVPEPGTFALVGMGLLGMGWAGRRRSR